MNRCLDDAMLQSYFDGELSGEMMESATLHLASCATCAAAAREVEQEIGMLTAALSAEFDAGVPTERLRERIDAAVLNLRINAASSGEKRGLRAFISSLLSFGTQRMLGYASLVVVLAFAAIFGLVKLRTVPVDSPITQMPETGSPTQAVKEANPPAVPTGVDQVAEVIESSPRKDTTPVYVPVKATKRTAPKPEPVRLLPGERSYLKTIARLDSAIKANQKTMRPSLQVEYQRNLAVVDRAIAATRTAAKSNPNDPDAADFMFAAYQSKVDLLNTIADARLSGGRPQ